jgi:hypothetical protein
MKFFTLVILPADTDISSDDVITSEVKKLMWPYRDRTCFDPPDGEISDDPRLDKNARWDGYSECPRRMLANHGYDVEGIPDDDALVICSMADLSARDFGPRGRLGSPAILTPDGQWLDCPSIRSMDFDEWQVRANATAAVYSGHHGILLFCHH